MYSTLVGLRIHVHEDNKVDATQDLIQMDATMHLPLLSSPLASPFSVVKDVSKSKVELAYGLELGVNASMTRRFGCPVRCKPGINGCRRRASLGCWRELNRNGLLLRVGPCLSTSFVALPRRSLMTPNTHSATSARKITPIAARMATIPMKETPLISGIGSPPSISRAVIKLSGPWNRIVSATAKVRQVPDQWQTCM
jgi:hypothetical protein